MAYDEALARRIRTALVDDPALTERRKLMARVGKDNYRDSLAHPHVREMDFTGKPMQGYQPRLPGGSDGAAQGQGQRRLNATSIVT